MYTFFKNILFLFSPEKAHKLTFGILDALFVLPGVRSLFKSNFTLKNKILEREVWGIKFNNPVGLAAGFDKDARHLSALEAMGFGFVEIGTVTPKPQDGNPRPRLFRLPEDNALINRMGFNNEGVEKAATQLKKRKTRLIIGGNIGKNKLTPNENAAEDYEICIHALHPYVDYFVVNLSSPNTPGLRDLQDKEPLKMLLQRCQIAMSGYNTKKPLLLKIAPDLTEGQLDDIIEICKELSLDGLVATNTTIARSGLKTATETISNIGAGGLSGAPLTDRALEVLKYLRNALPEGFPIISVGGIMTPLQAAERLKAGATLVQVYTGFVYAGPSFVKNINKAIIREFAQNR